MSFFKYEHEDLSSLEFAQLLLVTKLKPEHGHTPPKEVKTIFGNEYSYFDICDGKDWWEIRVTKR